MSALWGGLFWAEPGHIGLIYAASAGGVYTGLATPRTLTMLRTGQVISDRLPCRKSVPRSAATSTSNGS